MFLIPSHREQGLGPDAARAAVRYLMQERGWQRVTVDPYANNPRALHAWGKAGFVYARDLPDHPGGPAVLMAIERSQVTDVSGD
jgi:aminoglycoside 6'-N-acetyltransferase